MIYTFTVKADAPIGQFDRGRYLEGVIEANNGPDAIQKLSAFISENKIEDLRWLRIEAMNGQVIH